MVDEELQANISDEEPRLYEVGYHLLPTVAEEETAEEVSRIKEAIESPGGAVSSEEMPKLMQLAYSISKQINNERKNFNAARFGWIRFRMNPSMVLSFKEELKKNEKILRFIIIQAVHEKAVPSKRMTFLSGHKRAGDEKKDKEKEKKDGDTMPAEVKEEAKSVKSESQKISEAELDKTIEELIVE